MRDEEAPKSDVPTVSASGVRRVIVKNIPAKNIIFFVIDFCFEGKLNFEGVKCFSEKVLNLIF